MQSRKILLLAALGAAVLSAAAYGADDDVVVNEQGTLTVGYVKIGAESDWRMACNKSMTDTFTSQNGYFLLTSDAQQKQERQVKAVREFISQEVDYILLDPITETGWDGSLEEAKEAGIPVIVFDREVNVQAEDAYTAWLGSDFYLEGQRACAWLEAYLTENGYDIQHDELRIVHIQGTEGSSAQIGRTRALDEALEKHENWQLLDRQDGEFTTAKGKEVMVDMLDRFADEIQVVYCENDNEAFGAIDAIEEAGRKAGCDLKNGDILVLSFDATRTGLQLTLDGRIAVNTECAPLYGPPLTRLIAQLASGEETPYRQYVPEQQFSALPSPAVLTIDGTDYEVTPLSKQLIDERSY